MRRRTAVLVVAVLAGCIVSVRADEISWTGNSDSDFEIAANWSGTTTPPTDDTAKDSALFTTASTPANQTPTLSASRSVAGVKLVGAGWTLGNSANTLTLGNGGGTYGIHNVSGNNAVSAKIDLAMNQVWRCDANTLTVSGIISSSGGAYGITKNGGGALTLSGNNTYTGGTTLSGGTLTLSGNNNFGGAGFAVNAGTLSFANASNLGGQNAPVSMSSGTTLWFTGAGANHAGINLGAASGSTIYFRTVSGSTAQLRLGANLTLTGTSTLDVAPTTGGMGQVGKLHADAGVAIIANGNATFMSSVGSASGEAYAPVILNNVTLTVRNNHSSGSTATRLYGGVSGAGNVIIQGVGGGWSTGIWGNNTFAGELHAYGLSNVGGSNTGITAIRLRSGYGTYGLDLQADNALAPAAAASHPVLYWDSGYNGAFTMNGRPQTLGGLSGTSGSIGAMGALTLNVGAGSSYTFSGSSAGGGKLTKKGDGTQILGSIWSHSGGTEVQAGTLQINGAVSGAGAVTVTGGTLLLNGGSLAGASTVHAGATLATTAGGTSSKLVTVNANGILAPGRTNGVGALTITAGGLTLKNGAMLDFHVGTASDTVLINGGSFAGVGEGEKARFRLRDNGGLKVGQPVTLIDWSGGGSPVDVETGDFGFTDDSEVKGRFLIEENRLKFVVPPSGAVLVFH